MTDERRVRRALAGDRSLTVVRAVVPAEVSILSRAQGGDGRTVTAYAAVFNIPTQVHDQDGEYLEQIDPHAFDKTAAERGDQVFCVYNHAKTLHGTPSDLASVPVGRPLSIKPDAKGLLTVTRYNDADDQWADQILSAIRNGSLSGMSFTGAFLRSDPPLRPGQRYRADSRGNLPLVTRQEIALIEYGPTPIPYYVEAQVVGVRSQSRASGPVPYEQKQGENVRCPACSTGSSPVYNMPDANYCDQCGVMLPGSAYPTGRQGYEQQPGENVQDPNCMRYNDEDAIYCDQCGHGLPPSAFTGGDPAAAAAAADGSRAAAMDAADDADDDDDEDALDDEDDSERAASVDTSDWDASRAWHNGAQADDPAAFYAGICAAEKTTGDPATQDHWALPYRYTPSSAPNAAGVRNALSRLPQTEGLKDAAAAKAKLEGLMKQVNPDYEPDGSGTAGSRAAATADTDLTGHAAVTGRHTHSHSAFGSQGGDATHTHPHEHDGDASHSHSHQTSPPGGERSTGTPAAAKPEPPVHSATATSNARSNAMADDRMTVAERAARVDEIVRRLGEIDTEFSGATLPEGIRNEWDGLLQERGLHEAAIRDATARAQTLAALAAREGTTVPGSDPGSGYDADAAAERARGMTTGVPPVAGSRSRSGAGGQGRPANIWDYADARQRSRGPEEMVREYRDRARWALEDARFPGEHRRSREDVQEGIERLLAVADDRQGTFARHMLVTSDPVYMRAFEKIVTRGTTMTLTSSEQAAVQRALEMGTPGSPGSGSYPVPFMLDPTVTLTSNGAINALRQISRVEQIVGKEWLGVTSAGITVTRANELDEATDGSPTLVQPGVAPTRVQAFVPFSVEVEQDWNGLMAEISMMLADAKDVEEAGTFATGAGTGDIPQGIVTALSTGSGTASQIKTAGTATLAFGDIYAVEDAVPPRFRQQSSWLGSKFAYNAARQAFTQEASAAGDPWVRPSAGTPASLIGYPVGENSSMDAALTSGKKLLIQGDFKQYLIVDRVGMSIELVPHVFGGTSNYPTGQRGIYALWRNSAVCLVPNAFRMLVTL